MPGGTDVGFGVTIAGGSSSLGNVLSISGPNLAREAVNTSHSGTANGAMTFIPADLTDMGELVVETQQNSLGSEPPVVSTAAETWTLTFPLFAGDSTAANWAFSGFLTGYDVNIPIDDQMTATATIKVAGDITFTAAT